MARIYQNPPLIEAVFELSFNNLHWNSTIPGIFYNKISKDFPSLNERKSLNIGFDAKTAQVSRSEEVVTQFKNEENNTIVQLAPAFLSINKLPEYESWESFKKVIQKVLKAYDQIVEFDSITHIGLRYLNEINVPEGHTYNNIKKYANLLPAVPKGHEDESLSFQTQFQFPGGTGETKGLKISTQRPKKDKPDPLLIEFFYHKQPKESIQLKEISKWLDETAHPEIDTMFEETFTKDSKEIFN